MLLAKPVADIVIMARSRRCHPRTDDDSRALSALSPFLFAAGATLFTFSRRPLVFVSPCGNGGINFGKDVTLRGRHSERRPPRAMYFPGGRRYFPFIFLPLSVISPPSSSCLQRTTFARFFRFAESPRRIVVSLLSLSHSLLFPLTLLHSLFLSMYSRRQALISYTQLTHGNSGSARSMGLMDYLPP